MGATELELLALQHLQQAGVDIFPLMDGLDAAGPDPIRRGVVDRTLATALLDLYGVGKPPTIAEVQGRVDALASMCGHLANDGSVVV